jgi:hypothetical protein
LGERTGGKGEGLFSPFNSLDAILFGVPGMMANTQQNNRKGEQGVPNMQEDSHNPINLPSPLQMLLALKNSRAFIAIVPAYI